MDPSKEREAFALLTAADANSERHREFHVGLPEDRAQWSARQHVQYHVGAVFSVYLSYDRMPAPTSSPPPASFAVTYDEWLGVLDHLNCISNVARLTRAQRAGEDGWIQVEREDICSLRYCEADSRLDLAPRLLSELRAPLCRICQQLGLSHALDTKTLFSPDSVDKEGDAVDPNSLKGQIRALLFRVGAETRFAPTVAEYVDRLWRALFGMRFVAAPSDATEPTEAARGTLQFVRLGRWGVDEIAPAYRFPETRHLRVRTDQERRRRAATPATPKG